MLTNIDFGETISQAFLEYAEEVALNRSIPDVRDGLKLGLRQGLYAQYVNKLTHKNKYQKALKSVAAAMSLAYLHGDQAMYDTFIRAAKPWVYRYPLEEAQGSYGSPCAPDDQSSSRYVELRSSTISDILFEGLKKNCVKEWYMNYDNTEQIPFVFPTIGFWPMINGTSGIAVGFSTSVPPLNLKEVNAALVRLIQNPDIAPESIVCMPDFPAGTTIINADETRKSLLAGQGAACRMRATLEYHAQEHCIYATKLPHGVFTNTIIGELEKIISSNENYGIVKVIDHTKHEGDIHIFLDKSVDPSIMIEKLYKDTSLESSFGINMVMLDNGRFPKVFTQKAALQAYIVHIRSCKRNELEFDLNKLLARNHILEGLLTAIEDIDNVIHLIKTSESAAAAKVALMNSYGLDDEQAKAILDIKLQRLAHLEAIKLENEHKENCFEIDRLNDILGHQEKLDAILIGILEDVARKYGDERRTKITNYVPRQEEVEEIMMIAYRKDDTIKISSSKKVSGEKYETTNFGTFVFIAQNGCIYHQAVSVLEEGKTYKLNQLLGTSSPIIYMNTLNNIKLYKNWVFVTKKGIIKKSAIGEYNYLGKNGVKALRLKDDDCLVSTYLSCDDGESIAIFSSDNYYTHFGLNEVSVTGKTAIGVIGIAADEVEDVVLNPQNLIRVKRGTRGKKYEEKV